MESVALSPHPFTIRRKLGGLYAMTALACIGLVATVLYQLRQVEHDAKKVIEEGREAELAQDTRSALDVVRVATSATPGASDAQQLVVDRIAEARKHIDDLIGDSHRPDPSDLGHQGVENNLVAKIRDGLTSLRAPEAQRPMEATLGELSRLASVLEEETRVESARSHEDLTKRLARARSSLVVLSVGAAIVLLLAFWMLHHFVMRPVRQLARGANTFLQGDFDHRISIRSRDEFGDLSMRFNEMAARIGANRELLEERVRMRTRDFIQAAKFASLGTLAAGLAHEINTPIASIATCAEGLERRLQQGEISPSEEREYLQTIASEAYRVHEITSRLLTFARQEPGPKSIIDVRPLVREVAVILRHRFESAGVELRLTSSHERVAVLGNESELKQVVVNLLSNALDASASGDVVHLRVRQRQPGLDETHEGEVVEIEVEDEGSGIEVAHRDRVFEPFFTTKAPGQGTGLGLSLSYAIVETMQGELRLVDKPGRGALFRVTLRASEATT